MEKLKGATRIMGIDASTYIGMVQLGEPVKKILVHFPDQWGYSRLQSIATAICGVLDEWKPEVVIIEAYGLANKFNLVEMVEIGTLIRRELMARKIPWYNCTPKSLKLFAAGSGNADKPRMAEAVKARWNFESQYDDVVDAYALAKMGEHVALNGPDDTFKGLTRWDTKPVRKQRKAKKVTKPKGVKP